MGETTAGGQDRTGHDRKQETGSEQCGLPTLPKVPYLTYLRCKLFVLLCVCVRLCRYVFPVLFTCRRMKRLGGCMEM